MDCLMSSCYAYIKSCAFKQSQAQSQAQTCKEEKIEWNQTIPFIPPIDKGQVIKVYDGDTMTIAARLPYNESPLYRFSVRLLGIDSPEIKGKTTEEKEAAKKSQKALEDLILNKIVYLKDKSHEKYGRILANIYIDVDSSENQIHVNKWMLDNKYAYEYNGKTKIPFAI
jgi:endonuclease YncB( thermonuclease family)